MKIKDISDDEHSSPPFAQVFASRYAANPADGLVYFLDTCRSDSRQFFRSKLPWPLKNRSRSERLLRCFAHALTFQKNGSQALLIGDYIARHLRELEIQNPFDLIVKIGNDLSSLAALTQRQRGRDRRADEQLAIFDPFWQRFSHLIKEWGPISPPLYFIKTKSSPAQTAILRSSEEPCAIYLDLFSLHIIDFCRLPNCPLLFCFDTATTLLQLFCQPAWREQFMQRGKHWGFWVFDEDLLPQIDQQEPFFTVLLKSCQKDQLEFLNFDEKTRDQSSKILLMQAQKILQSPSLKAFSPSELASQQQQMRNCNFKFMAFTLGAESLLAVGLARDSAQWYSANYSLSTQSSALDLWLEQMLSSIISLKSPKIVFDNHRVKVIHLVSQLVDTCHSPTQLLRQLISYRSQNFEIEVISTERLTPRAGEYPQLDRTSPESAKRGQETIRWLVENHIPLTVMEVSRSWSFGLDQLTSAIERIKADTLVFHGPDLLHLILAQRFPNHLKVLFEHGSLPQFRGFDLAIASTEDAPDLFVKTLKRLGTKIRALPFCSDRRDQWQPHFVGKRHLGLTDETFAAITISNHLVKRLNLEFCQTVSRILQRCLKMHYVLIGPIENEMVMRGRFDRNVQDQIHFFGPSHCPADLARAADIYLNEFPFGGCLGILDALAAGCPVVSMYDPLGPAQARYGGLFMGKEYAIAAGDQRGYIDLACRLYQKPLCYFRASQRAFTRYEGRSNTPAYVREFEEIILKSRREKKRNH